MSQQGWTATGVIEAPLERVSAAFLTVTEGRVDRANAPLLNVVPGAGRLLGGATLRGGPTEFTVHYGRHEGGRSRWTRHAATSPFRVATSSVRSTGSPHTQRGRC
jgi:hypothetical protein